MQILDGKQYRDVLLREYKEKIEREDLKIRLDIILVGDDEASQVYVNNKLKYAHKIGIEAKLHHLSDRASQEEILKLIDELNKNSEVTGIILQSPTPKHIDYDYCAGSIDPKKDIDGFTATNICALYYDDELLLPCTVKGIIKLLEHYGVTIEGKSVTIVGRGKIVGKPLALALLNRNATVTLCHSKTENIGLYTKGADILISAVGKKGLIKEDMVKPGFVGIDVGIVEHEGKLYGDFDYENVKKHASMITPVPGGVGPMTIAMIMENLIMAKDMEVKNERDSKKFSLERKEQTK